MIYRIAIDTPVRSLFDYLPNADSGRQASIGCRVMVTFGRRDVVGIVVEIATHSDLPPEKLKRIGKTLDEMPVIAPEIMALARWAAHYYHHPIGEVLHLALPVYLRDAAHASEDNESRWYPTERGTLIDPESLKRSPKQQQALHLLRDHPAGLSRTMLQHLGAALPHLQGLASRGLAREELTPLDHPPFATQQVLAEPHLTSNHEQQAALDAINTAPGFCSWLLHGVTGSGKTEVYLQAIAKHLEQGRQALVMVPEIGLTPQTVNRFRQRFAVPVIALHSGLSDKERLIAWRRARDGSAGIIIGTRSAIFTPLHNPGLIIVDEEHDSSFKQQDGFRYSARDLALVRAKRLNIPVILGSATPSLESLHNATSARHRLLQLHARAGHADKPRFRLLDMKGQALQAGIAPQTLELARQELSKGHQVLFFINRRGFAPVLLCHDCGWHGDCPQCDAHLTLHRQPPHLHCHHCDRHQAIPAFCPTCSSSDLRPVGQGTERIEDMLTQQFKQIPVARIDRDTMSSHRRLKETLDLVHRAHACILVGTQMLAKGHHFPRVTLVIIVDVDGGLFSSDFRALEKTAQLIDQVAGRAGRAEFPGTVVMQTHHPEHPALHLLVTEGYSALAAQILRERQLVDLPPFSHLAILRAEALEPAQAIAFLQDARQCFASNTEGIELLGPLPSSMGRKGGRFRFVLVIRAQQRQALHAHLDEWLPLVTHLPTQRKVRWHIDIDPLQIDD